MDIAIVGPEQAGKTIAFDAMAAGHAGHGAGRENVAVVRVPDERLERLARLVEAEKVTPVELTLHDLPTLFQKGRTASGEAAESLSRADGLIVVVRAFRRPDVPHPRGEVDPQRDLREFRSEMALHDMGIVERRLEKLDVSVRSSRPGEREAGLREQALLLRVRDELGEGRDLRAAITDPGETRALANYGFLTLKPVLVVVNLDEQDIPRSAEIEEEYRETDGVPVAALCAKLEAELAELEPEEAAEFRREMRAEEPAASRLLRRTMEVLHLVTFYTPVGKECRAWPLPEGGTALEAAGRIHTDMERGFIRAEAIGWEELMRIGSFSEAKRQGRLRSEGKSYAVQDGDVLHILFHT